MLDLCAAPGGKATMLAGDVTAVEVNEARARELEENARRLGADERARRRRRTGARSRRSSTTSTARSSTLRARGSASSTGDPTSAGAPSRSPSCSSSCLRAAAARVRPGGTIVYSVCTVNAEESEASSTPPASRSIASLGDEWPQFRHPRRPEFLQTLPHVHGTAGFFVARLKVQ